MSETKHIIPHDYLVNKAHRSKVNEQKPMIVWLTGLSGSGKSTIANELAVKLQNEGKLAYILDGDNIRMGLCKDLNFSDDDRKENIRRIGEIAKLIADTGVIVITAFISPFIEERNNAKEIIGDDFIEVFVDASLEICENRDPKGFYKKARSGEIPKFTGISSPYEKPLNPDIYINTGEMSIIECSDFIFNNLKLD